MVDDLIPLRWGHAVVGHYFTAQSSGTFCQMQGTPYRSRFEGVEYLINIAVRQFYQNNPNAVIDVLYVHTLNFITCQTWTDHYPIPLKM